MFKERKKGVTIVALVVTIVVLLLLAGVTISVLFGENGLISKAKQASKEYESASHNEANFINFLQNYVTSIGGGSSSSNSSGEENNSSSGGNESGGEGENWKDIEILYEPTTPRNTSNGPDRYGIARGPITVTLKYGNTNLINRSRYQYKIGNGIWQDAAQTYVMEITENTQIKARYFDGTIGYKETSINITNVDNKGPNNFIPQITNTTTKEITVKGEAIDPSGIKGYCFSKDDGAHWTELQESNTYTFEELTTGSYYLRIKAIDRAGNDTVTEPINASTMTVPTAEGNIELTQSWENEVASVALKQNITGYNMQYRIGENGEWKNYEKPVNAELNQKVYARLSDGINYGKEIYLQIKDELRPTAPDIQVTSGIQGQNNWYTGEVTLKIKNGTDSESGVEKTTYQVTGVGAISETTIPTDGVIKITADGISTVTCYTYDKAGNKSPASTMEIKKDAVAPVVSLAVTSTTTNSITVKATANDVSSGLAKKDTYQYYYKKASDGQYTLAKTTSESNFTYEGLEQTTQYHMYVVAYDEAGLKTQSANAVQVTGTVPDGAGNITLTPKWNQGNCYVTAETTTQYSIQYQIGETSGTWKEYKNSVEVDLNQTIYVRLWDGTNGGNTASLKVVDSTAPSVPKIEVLSGSLGENNWYTSNVEIKITAGEDTQSGVTKTTYQVIGAGETVSYTHLLYC